MTTMTFCPRTKCAGWVRPPTKLPPFSPQCAAKAIAPLIQTRPLPTQTSQAARPGRAEMVKVLEPMPDTGPKIGA